MVVSHRSTEFTTLHLTDRRGGVVNWTVMSSLFPSKAVTLRSRVWSPGSKSRKFRRNDSIPTAKFLTVVLLELRKSEVLAYMVVLVDHHRNMWWRS